MAGSRLRITHAQNDTRYVEQGKHLFPKKDPDANELKRMNHKKTGALSSTRSAILTMAAMRYMCGLSYRACGGLAMRRSGEWARRVRGPAGGPDGDGLGPRGRRGREPRDKVAHRGARPARTGARRGCGPRDLGLPGGRARAESRIEAIRGSCRRRCSPRRLHWG